VPYTDLREWIKQLDKAGELRRISAPVSPNLEMAEIADRTAKLGKGTPTAGGPALLFENVTGYPGARVLMNQFGSLRRMHLALDTDSLDSIAGRIRDLIHPETPVTMMDKLKLLPKLAEVGNFFPKTIAAKDAACKEVIHRSEADGGKGIDLLKLPVLTTWPQDGGPFITLPCGRHPRPPHRQAQRRHVPDAGLRRPDHRHALAAPEERRRAPPRPPPRRRRTGIKSGCPIQAPLGWGCSLRRHHGPDLRRHRPRVEPRLHPTDHPHQSPRRPHGSRGSHRH